VLGVNLRGEKEVLGLWLAENEGAKFWLTVLTELRHRGVRDIFIACMDGLNGLPEAVNAVFPKTLIYRSATADEAACELDALETAWGTKYKAVVRLWRGNWDNIIPFFQFVPEIRKVTRYAPFGGRRILPLVLSARSICVHW